MIRIALLALLALSLPAAAQYPERPVTLLAGYPPGGLVDVVARLVAEGMKARFPKGIVVVNRPGAAGAGAVAGVRHLEPRQPRGADAPRRRQDDPRSVRWLGPVEPVAARRSHRGAGGAARRAQRTGRRQAHASSSRVPAAAPPGVP